MPKPVRFIRFLLVCGLLSLFSIRLEPAKLFAFAAQTPHAASISGRVTSATDGHPLRNVSITLNPVGNNGIGSSAFTDQNGNYTLIPFAAGAYTLQFEPAALNASTGADYLAEYYNNQATLASADILNVSANAQLTGIDAALEHLGHITGRITSAATGQAVAQDVRVYAYAAPTATSYVQSATPDDQGVYTLTHLAAGVYYVEFSSFGDYVSEFYNKQRKRADATPVTVADHANVTGIDAALDTNGALTGRVTDAVQGTALPNAPVNLYRKTDSLFFDSTQTDATGQYQFTNLAPDAYFIQVLGESGYLSEYYKQKRTLAEATPITLTYNVTTQVDIPLDRESTMHGRVTDAETGAPVANVTVYAHSTFTNSLSRSAQTDANGAYTINALWPGAYTLSFTPPSESAYTTEYYNNKTTEAAADQVNVPANDDVSGLDAALEKLGALTGQVTAADSGAPLAGVTVTVYQLVNCAKQSEVASTQTDANGQYQFAKLVAGVYRVHFGPDRAAALAVQRYLGQYYNNKPDDGPGDNVTVALNQTTANINAALQLGGLIYGRVTAADTGAPLINVEASFYRKQVNDFVYVAYATVDDTGNYASPALPAGAYRVEFYPFTDGQAKAYIREYYNSKPLWSSADEVAVTAGADRTGIDASLDRGGFITGSVKDAVTGAPLAGIEANVYSPDGKQYFNYGDTDENGVYTTGALPTGSYLVRFEALNESMAYSYTVQYYNKKPNATSADRVNVTANQTTTGIDALLTVGGEITGRVTAQNSGFPVADAYVQAQTLDGTYVHYAYTDDNGFYRLGGLPAGSYKVKFYAATYSDYCGRIDYSEIYYNQKTTLATADPVPVTVAHSTPNINGALPVKQITGNPDQGAQLSERVYMPLVRR